MDMNFGFYFSFGELNIIFYDLPYRDRPLWILVWPLIIYLEVGLSQHGMRISFPLSFPFT
jgi:hypothetical protein